MSYRAYPPPTIRLIGYDPVRDLPANHLAWLVESTVEAALQGRTLPPGDGQPPFDLRLCAKVLIDGYATGIRASRLLEPNCQENLPFLLLTRGDTPSYRTLCSFRVHQADIIQEIWLQLFVVANKLGFQRLGRVVIDSSKFKADASAESVVKEDEYEALRQQLQLILNQADQADRNDAQPPPGTTRLDREVKPDQMREILRRVRSEIAASKKKSTASLPADPSHEVEKRPLRGARRLERVVAALDTLDQAPQEGRKHACLTDPDARMMGEGRDKLIKECHSFEGVVDKDAQLLVAGQVTQEGNDNARLEPLLDAARPHEPEGIHSVDADSGYDKGEGSAGLRSKASILVSPIV